MSVLSLVRSITVRNVDNVEVREGFTFAQTLLSHPLVVQQKVNQEAAWSVEDSEKINFHVTKS